MDKVQGGAFLTEDLNLQIDEQTGTVRFAQTCVISDRLTIAEVTAAPFNARRAMGSLPFERFSVASADDRADLYFHDSRIVYADFHKPDPPLSDANLSDATALLEALSDTTWEEKQKWRNDALLTRLLQNANGTRMEEPHSAEAWEAVLSFTFDWGEVTSRCARGTMSAFIRVEYQGRRELAKIPYARVRKYTASSPAQALREKIRRAAPIDTTHETESTT